MKIGVVLLFCLTVILATTLGATDATIGVATANGKFLLDRSPVVGNANVFNGSVVETEQTTSDLAMNSGLKIRLGKESRGRVFNDRLVLEKGAGQISGPNSVVVAGSLHIMPVDSNSIARVSYGSKSLVEVAAVQGRVRVENAQGIRVANMDSGLALSFQAGASTPTTMSGKVELADGKYMLTDSATKVSVELRGPNLDKYVGKKVKVTGNLSGSDVLQVLTVVPAVSDRAAGGAAGAGAGDAGGSAGISGAVIAGIVVVGATGASLGIASGVGAFSGNASK